MKKNVIIISLIIMLLIASIITIKLSHNDKQVLNNDINTTTTDSLTEIDPIEYEETTEVVPEELPPEEVNNQKVINNQNTQRNNVTTTTTKKTTVKTTTTTTRKYSTDPNVFHKEINSSVATMPYSDILNVEIPDKYNTGVESGKRLTKYIEGSTTLSGIPHIVDRRSDVPVILIRTADLNKMSGNYTIQNVDFTGFTFRIYNSDNANKTHIKFVNCKFDDIIMPYNFNDKVTIEIVNSSLRHFDGSNTTLNKCVVGGGSRDGINPFKNVYINNSYIKDISGYTTGGELHYDGIQIYGSNSDKNFICHDVHFYNTRFEMPYIIKVQNGVPSSSYVNAPIMVQLEFNNATNISFNKVYVNGGGYTIYNHAVKGTKMYNVSYNNVYVGYGDLYNIMYPMQQSDILNTIFNNIGRYNSLMVSSVWKDTNGVHVITTNDTLVQRKLTCVDNNNKKYEFTMRAHPKLTKNNATQYTFESLPYDIDNRINNTNITKISCYDTTNTSTLSNNNLVKVKNV